MSRLKTTVSSTIIAILFFALLEFACRVFSFPGTYDYIERCVIEQRLAQKKAPGEYRILLYGESTMQGSNLAPKSTIGKWFTLYFDNLLPEEISRRVTVTNFGRLGEDSEFISRSFIETLSYKPDLAVFYTAHNDFIQPIHRKRLFSPKSFRAVFDDLFHVISRNSSLISLIKREAVRAKIARHKRRNEALQKIDVWYHESKEPTCNPNTDFLCPGSVQYEKLAARWKRNVDLIVDTAKRASVPIVLLEGVARWEEYEPYQSLHDPSLTNDVLAEWNNAFGNAQDLFAAGSYAEALAVYRTCTSLDGMYAHAYYRAGQCHQKLGDYKMANELYARANDLDHFPLRGPALVNQYYESLRKKKEAGVFIIPTEQLFEANAPNGIIDDTLIFDQIHPNIKGQALIALEIAKTMYENGLLAKKTQWRWDRLKTVEELSKRLELNNEFRFSMYVLCAGYVRNDPDKAINNLKKALEYKPSSVQARSWLAWLYWKKGEKKEALTIYARLRSEFPSLAEAFFKTHPKIARELSQWSPAERQP